MEATSGFEPLNKAFAEPPLTTWVRRLVWPNLAKQGTFSTKLFSLCFSKLIHFMSSFKVDFPKRLFHIPLITLFSLLGVGQAIFAQVPKPKIAVLDLVDINTERPIASLAEILRDRLEKDGKFHPISRDTLHQRWASFGSDPNTACNQIQCAFDLGSLAQAQFVLFGTASKTQQFQSITLKLLHIQSAKIIWAKVVSNETNPGVNRSQPIDKVLEDAISGLSPELPREKSAGYLAALDFSENTSNAKILYERLTTRVYGIGHYDVMSPSELEELLAALEINKFSIVPSMENMVALGQKIGVTHLIYGRLFRETDKYRYRLAMYDVANKAVVQEAPAFASSDITGFFTYEDDFFRDLTQTFGNKKSDFKKKAAGPSYGLWLSLGLLGLGGTAAAYWVSTLGDEQFKEDLPPGPPSTR